MGLMRESHFLVTLSVKPVTGASVDFGTWASLDGGDPSSEATVTKPGGMAPAIAVPAGSPTIESITVKRQFDQARDAQSAHALLTSYLGTGAQATVSQQPLGYDKVAFGTPLVDTGVITKVTRPKYDANSDNIAEFEVTVEPNGK